MMEYEILVGIDYSKLKIMLNEYGKGGWRFKAILKERKKRALPNKWITAVDVLLERETPS